MLFRSSGTRKVSKLSSQMLRHGTTFKTYHFLITESVCNLNTHSTSMGRMNSALYLAASVFRYCLKKWDFLIHLQSSFLRNKEEWQRWAIAQSAAYMMKCLFIFRAKLEYRHLWKCNVGILLHCSFWGLVHSVVISTCTKLTEESEKASKPKTSLQLFIHFCFPLISSTEVVRNQASYTVLNHVLKRT